MTALPALQIEAVVHPVERPALVASARQLADALSTASGSPHPTTLRFSDSLASISRSSEHAVVVASLLKEIASLDESLAQTEARWRDQLLSLEKLDIVSAFVCTIFRHVGSREAPALIERIRRLNRLAVQLSHDTGVGVIDIDRIFGYFGARQLQTDYRLGGRLGVELAGHTIVAGILATGLDDVIPRDVQERAQKVQAGMLDRLSGEVTW
jgi:hypothetical protein